MATGDTAKLIASLELQDKNFTRGLNQATSSLDKLSVKTVAFGSALGIGLERLAEKGIRTVIGAVQGGVESLTQLESATTSVGAALAQMGLAGQVSANQIAGWANDIEESVQAAFDDKAILAASTTLIRYGKITASNLRPALVVMTDLAAKTGSVESAATLLAKALADPEKAAGKLTRSGVVLTKAQQDQIKAMVKAGDVAKAQAYLLTQLKTATKGAAAASAGPAADAMAMFRDAIEDAQRALATGLLPLITEVRGKLTAWLKDPATLGRIKSFGEGLADAFRALLGFAEKIPWSSIGDALTLAGKGAKAVLDAFTSMPAWVQTAVVTGWGLNKLTGGALTGLAGSALGGLTNRGGTPANPVFVSDVTGGIGGKGGKGLLGGAGFLAPGLGALAAGIALPLIMFALPKLLEKPGTATGLKTTTAAGTLTPTQVDQFAGLMPGFRDLAIKNGALSVRDDGTATAIDGLADQRRGEITEGQRSTQALHDALNELIGHQGGAFLRAGDKAKTLDENAGKLVELFRTSTNPSLKSMQDNLVILQTLRDRGDEKTRQALSDDLAALQALIDRKLSDILVATQALKGATTGNMGWTGQREGERNPGTGPISVTVNPPSARDTYYAQQGVGAISPLPPRHVR